MGSWCEKKFDLFKPIKFMVRRIIGEKNYKKLKGVIKKND